MATQAAASRRSERSTLYYCFITAKALVMNWLPSFVKLFLVFVAGLVLLIASITGEALVDYSYTTSSILVTLRLVSFLLMVASPLLIALKFFAQLDKKR
jgi:hypothetical protein